MLYAYVALAAAGLAAAHPHQYGHSHLHGLAKAKRDVEVVTVAGPTVVIYSLNGQAISAAEVSEGISNGTLVWAEGAPAVNTVSNTILETTEVSTPTSTSTSTSPAAATSTAVADNTADLTNDSTNNESGSGSSKSKTTTTAAEEATTTTAAAASTNTGSSSSEWYVGSGVDTEFPDGELSCDTFPSAYGALDISWMGLGGWIGIQTPGTTTSAGYDDIVTGGSCESGSFCSYACPYGYQKTQWPSTQGATGQSVGGLECKNGKLYLTNSAQSTRLCETGTSAVTVQVVNKLSEAVSVCRTDYPGTESETVPLSVAAGGTAPLACPDIQTYYQWDGAGTSAQYYVNPAGVGVEDACQWGSSANDYGNWAPLNLGVGISDGIAYVAMLPNTPTTTATLSYKVTVSGGEGGESCYYEDGVFYSSVLSGGSSTAGCTIAATSGTVTYTFSD